MGSGGRLIALVGSSGSGKTTACLELVAAAGAVGLPVAGLVTTMERRPAGARRWVRDLRTGRRRLLATVAESEEVTAGMSAWRLSASALEWGDRALATACPAELLVIDELGPLELEQAAGWRRGAEIALAGPYGLAVVSVRPALLEAFRALARCDASKVVGLDGLTAGRLEEALRECTATGARS
jgi:nucleoside-triphosphatase THEP1